MRTLPEEIGACRNCGKGATFTMKATPLHVLGVSTPSNVMVGICGECGGISHIPRDTMEFITSVLDQAGVLPQLKGGEDQIVKEANYYLQKKTK